MSVEWERLQHTPCRDYTCPLAIDETNFILMPNYPNYYEASKIDGILNYHIPTNTWTQLSWTKLITISSMAFNEDKQIVYILNANGGLLRIQIKNKSNVEVRVKYIRDLIHFGASPQLCVIKDELHVIGGWSNNKHVKWNEKTETVETIHEFSQFTQGFQTGSQLIHLKSQNIVLSFGGCGFTSVSDYRGCTKQILDTIYSFDIATNKWHKLAAKLPEPMAYFGCTAIANDKYVLLFGGSNDDIFIYSVETQTFRKSVIKCPFDDAAHAITMNDGDKEELVVHGYVRIQWKILDIPQKLFPALYLLQLIQSWYLVENVHLFNWSSWEQSDRYNHWRMNTLDIIQ